MKKLLLLSTAAFFIISAGKAQSSDVAVQNDQATLSQNSALIKKERTDQQLGRIKSLEGEVSEETIQQFYADFGILPIVKTDGIPGYDKINFLKDGKSETAYYDNDVNLVGVISDKTFEDLPQDAQVYIDKNYSDYTVKAVRYFDDNVTNDAEMYLYDQQYADGDSYFVELGKDNKTLILHVSLTGAVDFFHDLK